MRCVLATNANRLDIDFSHTFVMNIIKSFERLPCMTIFYFLPLLQLYNAKDIAFLLDPKDSVQAYEEAGKMNKQESQYEKGMKALASMGHVQKLTAIEGKIMGL